MQANRQLAHETWSEYFDAVSKELVNAPVSIEIIGEPEPPVPEPEPEPLALNTIAYDGSTNVFEFAAARLEAHLSGVLRHLVENPARVAVDSHTMLAPMTIAVDRRDGVRVIIRIERDDDLAA